MVPLEALGTLNMCFAGRMVGRKVICRSVGSLYEGVGNHWAPFSDEALRTEDLLVYFSDCSTRVRRMVKRHATLCEAGSGRVLPSIINTRGLCCL